MNSKQDIVRTLIPDRGTPASAGASSFAPSNLALCKYWGKRDDTLNLPVNSSLSIALGSSGTHTEIVPCDGTDRVFLNDEEVDAGQPFAMRLVEYLDLFRPSPDVRFEVRTRNDFPTAAGFASSASGAAALVLAMNDLCGWDLGRREMSILARLGSGSACRSLYDGFVVWHAGESVDGMDSFAEALDVDWPELRIGAVTVETGTKPVSSRDGMRITRDTSPLFAAWAAVAESALEKIRNAVQAKAFDVMGQAAEENALAMHEVMRAARPPLTYWQPKTLETFEKTRQLRSDGVPIYFTIDAGPNVMLLFLAENTDAVTGTWPDIEVIVPFASD